MRPKIATDPVEVPEAARVAIELGDRHMTTPATTDHVRTPAERLAHEEYERTEKRRLELAEQRSDLNSPQVRIRTWERIHGLRLPSDPAHPIVDVIAVSTRLTLEDVREEQRTRTARRERKPELRAQAHGSTEATTDGDPSASGGS
jgi:hypothetical protein